MNNNSGYQTRDRNIDYAFRLYSSNANRGSSDDYGTTIKILMENPDVLEYYSNKFR